MMPATPYEADLAARVNARAPGATEELFSRYRGAVSWVASRWNLKRLDRREVEAEAWIRILRTFGSYDPAGMQLHNWLVLTSRSVLDNLLRQRRKHGMVECAARFEAPSKLDPSLTYADDLVFCGYLRSNALDPEAALIRKEQIRRFGEAVRALPPKHRVVLANDLRGNRRADVAARFGVTRQNIDQMAARAARKVQHHMAAA